MLIYTLNDNIIVLIMVITQINNKEGYPVQKDDNFNLISCNCKVKYFSFS